MERNIKVLVNRQPASLMCDVYLYSDHQQLNLGDVLFFYSFDAEGSLIETKRVWAPGESMVVGIVPTFVIPESFLRSFIAGFADLAKKQGVPLKSEAYSQGKLEAITDHLKDMRALVFKDQ